MKKLIANSPKRLSERQALEQIYRMCGGSTSLLSMGKKGPLPEAVVSQVRQVLEQHNRVAEDLRQARMLDSWRINPDRMGR